jgi:S1-C subfamily serine protease
MPEENASSVSNDAPIPPVGYVDAELVISGDSGESETTDAISLPPFKDNAEGPLPSSHNASKGVGKGLIFLIGFLGVIMGALLVLLVVWALGGFSKSTVASSVTSTPTTIVAQGESTTLAEAVAAKAMPSVVSIKIYQEQSTISTYSYGLSSSRNSSSSGSSSKSQTSNGDGSLEYVGLGSGIVLTSDGYILTNYHVAEDGDVFVVYFNDSTSIKATLVASDSSSDIAVLKVDKTGLTPIEIGDSDNVVVGEWCAAIGSPFGLEESISTGIVSALYRSTAMDLSSSDYYYYGSSSSSSSYAYYANMIQTDASINPGNSGGALVDSSGKLIGVCALIYSSSDSSAGVGCAIPAKYAVNIANQLIQNGYAQHPVLGVSVDDVDATTVDNYDVAASYGAYVASVSSGSVAESAGIKKGDVIVSYNGQKVTTASGLLCAVKSTIVGNTVTVGLIRNGQSITVTATLNQVSSS